MDGFDPLVASPFTTWSIQPLDSYLAPPSSQDPWISATCPPERTAQIMSGFSTWISPISCPWECQFPEAPKYRWALDPRHVSPPTDGLDFPGISRLDVSRFSCPRDSRFHERRYPDDPGILPLPMRV
jgi:hypothetical protein